MSLSRKFLWSFVTLLCVTTQLVAGPRLRALKNWVDSADIAGADTTFVRWPKEGFMGSLNFKQSHTRLYLDFPSDLGNQAYSTSASSNYSSLLSLGISYRGWGLSYSRDLTDSKDTEFSFCTYGQTYGVELRYNNTTSFTGISEHVPSGMKDLDFGDIDQKAYLCYLYYVVNHKRFSLPAALLQTVVQRRSAGSWLLAANFYRSLLHSRIEGSHRLSVTDVNVGGGYAYNLVFGREHFLFHSSLMPSVALWSHNHINETSVSRDFTVNANAHFALIYNASRYVAGVSIIYNMEWWDMKNDLSVVDSNWSSRAFIGVRF